MANIPRSHRRGSETRKRGGVIGFRADAAERAELEAAAERVGLTLGSYIRARALAKPATRATRRPTVEQAALAQLLAQLGKCGSNLNQIARALNSGQRLPPDIPEALADFRAVCADIMRALGREPHASALTSERRGLHDY